MKHWKFLFLKFLPWVELLVCFKIYFTYLNLKVEHDSKSNAMQRIPSEVSVGRYLHVANSISSMRFRCDYLHIVLPTRLYMFDFLFEVNDRARLHLRKIISDRKPSTELYYGIALTKTFLFPYNNSNTHCQYRNRLAASQPSSSLQDDIVTCLNFRLFNFKHAYMINTPT